MACCLGRLLCFLFLLHILNHSKNICKIKYLKNNTKRVQEGGNVAGNTVDTGERGGAIGADSRACEGVEDWQHRAPAMGIQETKG
jgi:hypothetical protein